MVAEKYYKCQQCGNCCRVPGTVKVTEEDIERLCHYLEMSPEKFRERYTDLLPDRSGLTLIEKENHVCIFLNEDSGQCSVHPAKPHQCRTFPNQWNYPGFRRICNAKLVKKPRNRPIE